MDAPHEGGDPFAIPDLWKPSIFTKSALDGLDVWSTGLEDIGVLDEVHASFKPLQDLEIDFSDPFHFGPLESIDSAGESVESSDIGPDEGPVIRDLDIWAFEGTIEPSENKVIYRSWDAFTNPSIEEPRSGYISEWGPQAFDAALSLQAKNDPSERARPSVVQSDAFTMCLLYLGQGRSSVFFRYDEAMKTFYPTFSDMKVSGYSTEIIERLTSKFVRYGTTMRYLRTFAEETYTSRTSWPALVAVAEAVSVVLSALQNQLGIRPDSIQSLLHLQSLFNGPGILLECINDVVLTVSAAKGDEELLSRLYEKIHQLEHKSAWLREILFEMLARVSKPWLEVVEEWCGLRRELQSYFGLTGKGKSFVKTEPRSWIDERGVEMSHSNYTFDCEKVPVFIMDEDARIMFESGKSLRFLQTHHPQHPLARPDASKNAAPPKLEWKFSWTDVERITTQANDYERTLTAAIKDYIDNGPNSENSLMTGSAPSVHDFDLYGRDEEDVKRYIAASTAVLNEQLPTANASSKDRLHDMVLQSTAESADPTLSDGSTFAPPFSLAPLLSFNPILSTQARLINSSCVRLFFKEHHLRSHLSLQRRFQLFGDGVFASRLSHALFDPELETTERRQGVTHSGAMMGLKLGSRDNWPPASSELRLALMGVLTECYRPSGEQDRNASYLAPKSELPGGLSFAVRDMSEEELQKCMDPNDIEALDFLRLQYKPPPPLEPIITPTCLHKYDKLFKLLLRVVRMLFVVNQLFRDATGRTSYWQGVDPVAQKFRIEAHHFVSNVSSYFFDVGVGVTWQKFEDKLDEIERRIDSDDAEGTLGDTEGLHKLQEYHERILDRIMFAMFLRRRQKQVLKLLEDIFTQVLKFARYSRSRASGERRRPGDDVEVRQMYVTFRKKIGVFVSVCRGLSEKKGYGDRKGMGVGDERGLFGSEDLNQDGENSIGQLLLRLEMSGYYSKSP